MGMNMYGPAVVESVKPVSAAAEAGIKSGDRILEIDGRSLRDVIDCYLLFADGDVHNLTVERGSELVEASLDASAGKIGIQFAGAVFGKVMMCNNRCIFCFVDQMPHGLRDSLYVKDDDYRLSFLQGNFITLTNLGKDDLSRIINDRLSPLYVSLHSTDPALRRIIFGNDGANRALKVLSELLEEGIEVHIQIVLMKGINDSANLDRTLDDIGSKYPGVSSIGVVPVGITSTGSRRLPGNSGYDRDSAVDVLTRLYEWRKMLGRKGPYASDEFFYLAGEDPPPSDYYGKYPQAENGIGLTRLFLDGLDEARMRIDRTSNPERTVVVTAPMGAWALQLLGLESLGVKLMICNNSLFGGGVTVAGLLNGKDVARRLKETPWTQRALVSGFALSNGCFIDGSSIAQISSQCGVEVMGVPPDSSALIDALVDDRSDDQ